MLWLAPYLAYNARDAATSDWHCTLTTRRISKDHERPRATMSKLEIDEAIAIFEQLGGKLTIGPEGEFVSWRFYEATFTSDSMSNFSAFPGLRGLEIWHCEVDDSIWPYVSEMSNLESLSIWNAGITDFGLQSLRHMSKVSRLLNLERLNVLNTGITEHGLE